MKCLFTLLGMSSSFMKLLSITVTTRPSKTSYKAGEDFDPTGMVITANYGIEKNTLASALVTGYLYSPHTLSDGDTKVTITYTEKGITKTNIISVTVTHVVTGLELTTLPTKTSYVYGEDFNPAGLSATVAYSDGTTEVKNGAIFSPESSGKTSLVVKSELLISLDENDLILQGVYVYYDNFSVFCPLEIEKDNVTMTFDYPIVYFSERYLSDEVSATITGEHVAYSEQYLLLVVSSSPLISAAAAANQTNIYVLCNEDIADGDYTLTVISQETNIHKSTSQTINVNVKQWSWGDENEVADENWWGGLSYYIKFHTSEELLSETSEVKVGKTKVVQQIHRFSLSKLPVMLLYSVRVIGINLDGDKTVAFLTKDIVGREAINGYTIATFLTDFGKAFPGRHYLKTVKKGTCTTADANRNATPVYEDVEIFIPSEREMGLDSYSPLSVANSTNTNAECTYGYNKPYAYYSSNNNRIKKYYTNTDWGYYTRSISFNDANIKCCINLNGESTLATDIELKGLAPAFVIGEPKPYLTFSSDTSEFNLNGNVSNVNLEISTDAENWTQWDGSETTSSNKKIYLRGTGCNSLYRSNLFFTNYENGTNISCIGNIESILDYHNILNRRTCKMPDSCFDKFFNGLNLLDFPPELPSLKISFDCYDSMFDGCGSLIAPPQLPAKTLYMACYKRLCNGCDSLLFLPKLVATKLETLCYAGMFSGCHGIKLTEIENSTYIPYRIPANGLGTISGEPLQGMFANTGGDFTGTPEINKTYYLNLSIDNTVVLD